MKETTRSAENGSTRAALEAFERGYTPIPVIEGGKMPYGTGWPHTTWNDSEQVQDAFNDFNRRGVPNIGLVLGDKSGGLVDIDLDNASALRVVDDFLPKTPMISGRAGRPASHRWYRVIGDLPSTRKFTGADGQMVVEFRASKAQTVIAPSIHPSKELYRWEGEPWGGQAGPREIEGKTLLAKVTFLAIGVVLMDNWPKASSHDRHEAYLPLVGGLLRYEGGGVHPVWETRIEQLIRWLAYVTRDNDGPETRVAESIPSTMAKLREGGQVTGFPRLAEHIGPEAAEKIRRYANDFSSLLGVQGRPLSRLATPADYLVTDAVVSKLPPEERNPMEERGEDTWLAVDLEPYLFGDVQVPEPTLLRRTDGKGLMYPGRVNSLFGLSESGKTWVALEAGVQEVAAGGRVVVIDLEDMPETLIMRLQALGMGPDDISKQVRYVHPEGPLADMQMGPFGVKATDGGKVSAVTFMTLQAAFDPTLIIVDGMTVLYGLHGLNSNDAMSTEIITGWLKRLARNGRTTVIVIDHTGKSGGTGSSPIGAHHKIAMVQGTALRVDVIDRPMPGAIGKANLVVFKDRPGAVRMISSNPKGKEQIAGEMTIDSTVKGVTRMTIDPPDPDAVDVDNSDGHDPDDPEAKAVIAAALELLGGDLAARVTTKEVSAKCGVEESLEALSHSDLSGGPIKRRGEGRGTKWGLREPDERV